MEHAENLLTYESLAFFGKVNASISHELKNVMAIISETAGLLGDLADMASAGSPVEPGVLKNCTASIVEEIQRGYAVIRQMNLFAHSIDSPLKSVDLREVLDLVTRLAGFLSFAGKARVEAGAGGDPVVWTCPFLLQTVFYQALVRAYESAGPGAEVTVTLRSEGDTAWTVTFSGFEAGTAARFPDDACARAAEAIGIGIRVDADAGRWELEVPCRLDTAAGRQSAAV